MRLLPLLLIASSACQSAKDKDGIEITGYLDASRISVTTASDPTAGSVTILVAGGPEAATDLDEVTLTNTDSGASIDGDVADDGSFAIAFAANTGETIEVSGGGADPVSVSFEEPLPFPDYVALNPHPPDANGQVAVTLELTGAHPDLDVLLSNPAPSASSWATANQAIYTGSVMGEVGDILWVQAIGPDPIQAIEIPVPAN